MSRLRTLMIKKPYLALLISVISVSFAAIFIVSISKQVSPLTIAFYRLFITSLFLIPVIILHKKYRDELKKIKRSTFLIMIVIGFILAAHFALWLTSLDHTSVASSVILVTAHPILVAPIAHIFYKEKLSIINLIGISISLIGVSVLVLGNRNFGFETIDTLYGNILAILGGIAAGLYILGGRKIRKSVSVINYAFIVYSIGTLILFILCITLNSSLTNLKTIDILIIILMALISGILGHTVYNWSLKHVRASLASVALLGEPLGSALLAFVIPWINQIPSKYTFLGGTFILLGIYLTARKNG